MQNKYSPDDLICPGATLKEYLISANLNIEKLARLIDLDIDIIMLILSGEKRITEKIALKLVKVFSMPVSFWLNLENNYQRLKHGG